MLGTQIPSIPQNLYDEDTVGILANIIYNFTRDIDPHNTNNVSHHTGGIWGRKILPFLGFVIYYEHLSVSIIDKYILLFAVSANLAHRLDRLLQVRYDVAAIAAVILT